MTANCGCSRALRLMVALVTTQSENRNFVLAVEPSHSRVKGVGWVFVR